MSEIPAFAVLVALVALMLGTELLPPDCWINRALAALSDTCGNGEDEGETPLDQSPTAD